MNDRALAQWLALREPVDAASRSERLMRTIADAVQRHDPLQVLDLASGTGSNIRYLMDRLPARRQRWLAADHSPTLLTELPIRISQWGAALGYDVDTSHGSAVIRHERLECHVETRQLDLDTLPSELFAGRHLVTASALLDLVSESWLTLLASRCRAAGAAALFTITYNGRSTCSPSEPEDDIVRDLFNRHQRTDKGLGGPAAGPDAARYAVRAFADAGYQVETDASDWVLGPDDAELQRQLIEGWAQASTEIAPDAASMIADWRSRRIQHLESGISHLVVSHHDIAAWLDDPY